MELKGRERVKCAKRKGELTIESSALHSVGAKERSCFLATTLHRSFGGGEFLVLANSEIFLAFRFSLARARRGWGYATCEVRCNFL